MFLPRSSFFPLVFVVCRRGGDGVVGIKIRYHHHHRPWNSLLQTNESVEAENEIVGPTYETNGLRVILTRHSCNHRSRNTILRIARTYIPVRAPIVALNHPTIFSPPLSFFFFLFSFFFFLVRCIIKSPLYTIWLHIVGIFFVLILETKWKIKSLQFYPK